MPEQYFEKKKIYLLLNWSNILSVYRMNRRKKIIPYIEVRIVNMASLSTLSTDFH